MGILKDGEMFILSARVILGGRFTSSGYGHSKQCEIFTLRLGKQMNHFCFYIRPISAIHEFSLYCCI